MLMKVRYYWVAPGNHYNGDKGSSDDNQWVISWIGFQDIGVYIKSKGKVAECSSQCVNETTRDQGQTSN